MSKSRQVKIKLVAVNLRWYSVSYDGIEFFKEFQCQKESSDWLSNINIYYIIFEHIFEFPSSIVCICNEWINEWIWFDIHACQINRLLE